MTDDSFLQTVALFHQSQKASPTLRLLNSKCRPIIADRLAWSVSDSVNIVDSQNCPSTNLARSRRAYSPVADCCIDEVRCKRRQPRKFGVEVQDAPVAFRRYSPGCDTEYSLERYAEGGVGIVAHGFCHFEPLLITRLQQFLLPSALDLRSEASERAGSKSRR
jgi:hypothetical protein